MVGCTWQTTDQHIFYGVSLRQIIRQWQTDNQCADSDCLIVRADGLSLTNIWLGGTNCVRLIVRSGGYRRRLDSRSYWEIKSTKFLPTDRRSCRKTRIMRGGWNVVVGSDIARSRGIDRKIGALPTGGGSETEGQTSLIRGVRSQDLDPAGKTIGSGADIVASAETGRKMIIPLGARWVWGSCFAHRTGGQ